MLLAAPRIAPREVVADKNGLIINAWRALKYDPEQVAYWADMPTNHWELHSVHYWMIQWIVDNKDEIWHNPDFFDAKAAGRWLYGVSNWIGSNFGDETNMKKDKSPKEESRPNVISRGVQMHQKPNRDIRPTLCSRGVQIQRTPDSIPWASTTTVGGRGVMTSRRNVPGSQGEIFYGDGSRLVGWFTAIQQRLANVYVLNRDWQSAVTPAVLGLKKKNAKVAILMDPPYKTQIRNKDLYASDIDGTSDKVAEESYEWALQYGERYRICYAMHASDFPTPKGWISYEKSFGAHRDAKNRVQDQIIFSPACLEDDQMALF